MTPAMKIILLSGGKKFDPAASAIFAAMTTPPTAARKIVINTLVLALKAAGVWNLLDVLYIAAAADAQAARLNWKNPGTFTLSPQNSPTFTADRGYQGDGATSYLLTGYTPSVNGVNFVQDNASGWIWSRTAAAGTGTETDAGAGNLLIACRSSANQARIRVNDATTSTMPSVDGSGLFGATRAAAGIKKIWRNGVQMGADIALASTAVAIANQSLCGNGGTTFSTRQQAVAAWGASLTGLEAAFYNAVNTYLTSVGAA